MSHEETEPDDGSRADVVERGETAGFAYKLNNEFWVVNTSGINKSTEVFKEANLFTSRTATLELAGVLRLKVEGSFADVYLANILFEAATPLAATVVLGPGPSISYDAMKGKMVTNSVCIAGKTGIELSTYRQRETVGHVKAVLAEVEAASIKFNSTKFRMGVAQRAFMAA